MPVMHAECYRRSRETSSHSLSIGPDVYFGDFPPDAWCAFCGGEIRVSRDASVAIDEDGCAMHTVCPKSKRSDGEVVIR